MRRYCLGVVLAFFGLFIIKYTFFELGLIIMAFGLWLIDRTKMPRRRDKDEI